MTQQKKLFEKTKTSCVVRPQGIQQPHLPLKKAQTTKKNSSQKFQVSRSHLLDFNHFARILSLLYEQKRTNKVSRKFLIENLGLPDGQIASLISIGASMDLIETGNMVLTPVGMIIAKHDVFLENHGTLEWCHFKASGSSKNLIWFDVFNHLLSEESAMIQEGWEEYFRKKLKSQYSMKTVLQQVPKEVRFIVDLYTNRNFKKLELLSLSSDQRLYRRRYSGFAPLILAAMIYDYGALNKVHLFQVGEMAEVPGSPAMVFGLDAVSFRKQIEGLHDHGWLRYETLHNLDQIRLKQGFSALEFLAAYYKDREPKESNNAPIRGIL